MFSELVKDYVKLVKAKDNRIQKEETKGVKQHGREALFVLAS